MLTIDNIPDPLKPLAIRSKFFYNRLTRKDRVLPNFIIVGAQKGGTSSLHYYLKHHPQIIPAFKKEIHYFNGGLDPGDDNFRKGESWYRAHFRRKGSLPRGSMTFEASPMYFYHPLAADRIHQLMPDIKLIFLLRNPVERAISQYHFNIKRGTECLEMEEAFSCETSRLAPVIKAEDYNSVEFLEFAYLLQGHYARHLARFFRLFPRQNLLILQSERFFTDTGHYLGMILDFLGLNNEIPLKDLRARNVGKYQATTDKSLKKHLQEYFSPLNKELFELLGTEFSW